MEEAFTTKVVLGGDYEKLSQMYTKVVGSNYIYVKKGFIKCPECGEEILIVPTLRKMNEAIENHVQLHKEKTSPNLLLKHTKPISIRLALAQQILHRLNVA
jgi:hypothetical protein